VLRAGAAFGRIGVPKGIHEFGHLPGTRPPATADHNLAVCDRFSTAMSNTADSEARMINSDHAYHARRATHPRSTPEPDPWLRG
jgi:hypothetical protein